MTGSVVTLESDALPADCEVVALSGHEGMNALPAWSVEILCPDTVASAAVVRAAATLHLVDREADATRSVRLVITDIADEGRTRDGHLYVLSLSAPEWLLGLRSGYRVFVEKTTQQVVQSVLRDAGVPADRVAWRLAGAYLQRLQCVQYGETDWGFVERLLADEGIMHWFDATENGPLLVLGDDPGSHDGIAGSIVVPFEDASGMVAVRSFFDLELSTRMTVTGVHLRDYDVRQPDVLIEGKAGTAAFELFEYPAGVLTKEAAGHRAKVRLEQLQREKRVASGRSDCLRIQPGRVLAIDGCADEAANARYVVTAVEHDFQRPTPHAPDGRPYRNRVRMVPAHVPFRPRVPEAGPRIPGVESAVTTGAPGEEIHVDDLGRVKLRHPWDRSGVGDDTSSGWARTLQMNMGGTMLLPRVGWEVPVMYMHGDPDQPIVLGRVYNATAVVPYPLPAAAATTTFQSATSPGGGGTNELRMGDGKGGMEMFVHATRDQTVSVGGSATTKVGANETHDVGLSHEVTIGGSHTHSVGASQSVNVGTDMALGVRGGRAESIGGMESVEVTANRGVTTGSYTEIVGAMYGLQCNQSNTNVSGAFLQLVGASLNLGAGLGTGENVAAARTEIVGGARTILAGKYAESVTGVKNVTAGVATDKAGGKVRTFAKAGGSVKAASANISAGGPVLISAPTITVDVGGNITAGAMQLGGGTLKATKGTTKLKGTIKRQGETKIE